MIILDLVVFNEIITAELTNVTGGAGISVDTTKQIKIGRDTFRVDPRDGLKKDEDYPIFYENCVDESNNFIGISVISCYGISDVINRGEPLYAIGPEIQ